MEKNAILLNEKMRREISEQPVLIRQINDYSLTSIPDENKPWKPQTNWKFSWT
jgi:hypothetical protein